jgi:hypothetical protein
VSFCAFFDGCFDAPPPAASAAGSNSSSLGLQRAAVARRAAHQRRAVSQPPKQTHKQTKNNAAWLQRLEFLEVLHAGLGLVRSSAASALLQWMGRSNALLMVVQPLPHVSGREAREREREREQPREWERESGAAATLPLLLQVVVVVVIRAPPAPTRAAPQPAL